MQSVYPALGFFFFEFLGALVVLYMLPKRDQNDELLVLLVVFAGDGQWTWPEIDRGAVRINV